MAEDIEEKPASLFTKKEQGVLVAGGKSFAVGLVWLTADQDFSGNLLKPRAEKLGADYTCIRATIATQNAFGFIRHGHKMGMPAAAAIAADMLVGDWHGVFTADNGWWYIAVHSDNISPDGDRLFFSEEEAYNHFMEQAGLYNWPRSYAPETWNIEDAVPEIPLPKLLEDLSQAPVLKANNLDAIFGGRKRRNFAFFIGLIALAFLFSAAILPAMISKAKEKHAQAVQPIILAPAVIKPPPKIENIQQTGFAGTLELPRPSVVLQICAQGLSAVIEPLPGWQLNSASCAISSVNVNTQASWKRKVGSLDIVKSYLSRFPSNVIVNYDGKDGITAQIIGGDLKKVSSRLSVLKREDLIRILYDRFGGLGKMELTDVVPPPPQPQRAIGRLASETPAPQRPPYLRLKLETKTPPDIMASYFDVPGLKLQNVNWSIINKRWTYTGEILFESQLFNEFYGGQASVQ